MPENSYVGFLYEYTSAFYVQFLMAVFCWITALFIGSCYAILVAPWKPVRGIGRGAAAWFGMMPAFFLPRIFSEAGVSYFTVFGTVICTYVPPLLITVLLFPAVESSATSYDESTSRFASLSKVGGLTKWCQLKEVIFPDLVGTFFHTAAFTFPFAVLLVVIFDWAYGRAQGIGIYTQSVIQLGDVAQRSALIIAITLPTLFVYTISKSCAGLLDRKFSAAENVLITDAVVTRITGLEEYYWWLGLIVGGLLYVILWSMMFSGDPRLLTPWPLVQHLANLQQDPYRDQLVTPFLTGVAKTIIFGITAAVLGVLSGGLTALAAHKWRSARAILWLLATMTQVVPMFVLIPLYQMLIRSKIVLVVLVGVTISFYIAYNEFLRRLDSMPRAWADLRAVALPKQRAIRGFRSITEWYCPMLLRFAAPAFAVSAPWGVLAALVADLFLDVGGLASFAFLEHSTDAFVAVVSFNAALLMMLGLYLTTRSTLRQGRVE